MYKAFLGRNWDLAKAQHFPLVFSSSFFLLLSTLLYWLGGPSFTSPSLLSLLSLFIIFALFLLNHFLFHQDYQTGFLEILFLEAGSFWPYLLTKILFFWTIVAFPLCLLTPLIATMYLPLEAPGAVLWLLLGITFLYTLLMALGSALTLGGNNSQGLLFLLILPLYIPLFLVSHACFEALDQQKDLYPYLKMLLGLGLIYSPMSLLSINYSLRTSVE